jgi:hypothetical protein
LPLKLATNVPAHDPALPWLSNGGEINDASTLSLTPIYGIGLFYGHLSTSPGNFLEDMIVSARFRALSLQRSGW